MRIICTRVVYGEVRLIIAFRRERPQCASALCSNLFIYIYIRYDESFPNGYKL